MKRGFFSPLWLWAAMDLLRRPSDAVLIGVALWSLTAVTAAPILLSVACTQTTRRLLERSPDLVVRRVNAGGWAPMPVSEAVASVAGVAGVTGVRARIWGTVAGEEGPVTVVGWDGEASSERGITGHPPRPNSGEAVISSDPADGNVGEPLVLEGYEPQTFRVVGILDPAVAGLAGRLLLVHPDDARRLLGLAPGMASDLAVTVFHDDEAEALAPDLARVLPWPVRIVTRKQAFGREASGYAKSAARSAVMLVPALVATLALAVTVVRERLGRKREIGLLKALGWTAGDVVALQLIRAVLVAAPAASLGAAAAWWLVFSPGTTWAAAWLLPGAAFPPALYLDSTGAFWPLSAVAITVVVPYLAAVLLPTLRAAASHPGDLMEDEWTA